LGEFGGFTLIYEENVIGGIEIWSFLGVMGGRLTWGKEEGGQQCVFCALGGFIWVKLGRFSCMCLGYVMVVWVACMFVGCRLL
jgi:hypothetical protein